MQNQNLFFIFVPVFVPVNFYKKLYTTPKIHIPKVKKDGVLTPTIEKGNYWYVYYWYRNPKTNLLEKFIKKKGINRIQSIGQRTKAAKNLQRAILKYLQEGFNPFEYKNIDAVEKKTFTILEAFTEVFNEKKKVWGETAEGVHTYQFGVFKKWLIKNNLTDKDIEELSKRHIVLFLNGLKVGNTTRNNYRRILATLNNKMVDDEISNKRVVNSIPKLKETPKKNETYTKKQLAEIKEWLIENDPYLYSFIKFIMFGFMREIDVVRLKIKHINLEDKTIRLGTKTEVLSTIPIIKSLYPIVKAFHIEELNPEYSLFTKDATPGIWEVGLERSKVNYFINKFKKCKNALGLSKFHGMYSFRHTYIKDIYTNYLSKGLTPLESKHKLMTITRHKTVSSLEKYLRDIGALIPKDYSGDYTLDF